MGGECGKGGKWARNGREEGGERKGNLSGGVEICVGRVVFSHGSTVTHLRGLRRRLFGCARILPSLLYHRSILEIPTTWSGGGQLNLFHQNLGILPRHSDIGDR